MLFGKQHPHITPVQIGSNQITRSSDIVYLGLRIDSRLTWCTHINYIISHIKQFRYTLFRLRCAFSPTLRAYLAKVFILPIIDLYSIIYAPASMSNLHRLDVVYNDLMRTLAGTRRSDHISINSLYQMSSLEPLRQRRDRLLLTFIHKVLNSDVYSMLGSQCIPCPRMYDTRSQNQYLIPWYNTNFGSHRILVRGLRLFNRVNRTAE